MGTLVDLGTLDQRLTDLQRPASSGFSPGLCRAVAERLGVDPLIVRVIVVALTFAAGLGVVLYAWGTLLTPRPGGQPPIDRYVPAFGRWPRRTQLWVIVISSLVVVMSSASSTTSPLGPAIIILSLVWLSRRRSASLGGPVATSGPAAPVAADVPDPAEAATVEEWRSRLGAHAARRPADTDRLPVVDLYGPEPQPAPAAPPARTRTSWFGAIAIVALGLLAGVTAASVGAGVHPVLMAMATCTATVGVSMLAWALLIRSRRLPGFLIAVVLAGAAVTSAYAIQHAAPAPTVAAPADDTVVGEDLTYEFVADSRGLVDLSHLSLDDVRTVHVDATVSEVRILLPGRPAEQHVDSTMASVEHVETRAGNRVPLPTSGITLDIIATMSNVTVEFPA